MRKHFLPAVMAALIGSGFAGYAYFAQGTGVTGSTGALLALVGSLAVILGVLLAAGLARRGKMFGLLLFLSALGALLTAIAGVFLMQYGLAVAMALALAGVAFAGVLPARTWRAA